ncbi:SH3 domain-containing protein [Fodinibius sediminis]|uniref:SH3 domain-containing protein n=1 Tax=Fodinibius sediminis TaxID=1214077 RepID=A0A521DBT0_9BACT|nr:SH3 domain-containing protein [Fodinibius sediminis]SMO69254.1 hypothetical protein SAMN06265218_109170 [Fodinibius sediminis]
MYAKFIHFSVAVVTLSVMSLLSACSSSTWEEARQADTYEAYQAYISENPDGEHLEKARKRADNRYWTAIEHDTTARSFEKYLKEFPEGSHRPEAQQKMEELSGTATEGRVTGSNIIIRSDHTTRSPSAGVVANEGTVVKILDQYSSGNSKEAILKRDVTITEGGNTIKLPGGKAINILDDLNDSVRASFSTPDYGRVEATISKRDVEAISGETWYKIHTSDGITGWIYGKFIKEL